MKRKKTQPWKKTEPDLTTCAQSQIVLTCLTAMDSSWTFSPWSHDGVWDLEHNSAALLCGDWNLWFELPLIIAPNALVETFGLHPHCADRTKQNQDSLRDSTFHPSHRLAGRHMTDRCRVSGMRQFRIVMTHQFSAKPHMLESTSSAQTDILILPFLAPLQPCRALWSSCEFYFI